MKLISPRVVLVVLALYCALVIDFAAAQSDLRLMTPDELSVVSAVYAREFGGGAGQPEKTCLSHRANGFLRQSLQSTLARSKITGHLPRAGTDVERSGFPTAAQEEVDNALAGIFLSPNDPGADTLLPLTLDPALPNATSEPECAITIWTNTPIILGNVALAGIGYSCAESRHLCGGSTTYALVREGVTWRVFGMIERIRS